MKKLGAELIHNHADFRMVTRRALNAFLQFHENNLFIQSHLPHCWISFFVRLLMIVTERERLAGETKYPSLKKNV